MGYFTLKVNTPDMGNIYQTDFLLGEFDGLFRRIMAQIAQMDKLKSGKNEFRFRLIPKYDSSPKYEKSYSGKTSELKTDLSWIKKNKHFVNFHFEKDKPTDKPVKYFTIEFYNLDQDFFYKRDFHLIELSSLINYVIDVLKGKGKIKSNEDYNCDLIARDGDEARVDPVILNRPKEKQGEAVEATIVIRSGKKEQAANSDTDNTIVWHEEPIDESLDGLIDIDMESEEDSLEVKSKKVPSEETAKEIGTQHQDDLKIFIYQDTYDKIKSVTKPSLELGKELIGILVGEIFRDQESDSMFLEISDIISADKAPGGFEYALLDNQSLNKINDKLAKEYPGKYNVGWYHTHLIKAVHLKKGDKIENAEIRTAMFFSQHDHFVHGNFFKRPWHVAIVVDADTQDMIVYQWKYNKIERSGAFFIIR